MWGVMLIRCIKMQFRRLYHHCFIIHLHQLKIINNSRRELTKRAFFKGRPQTQTCSVKVGEFMQLNSLRPSCSTRSRMESSTTSTLFSWRSFTGSRLGRPPGLASANRRSSWVAVEMAWPGGSSLNDEVI